MRMRTDVEMTWHELVQVFRHTIEQANKKYPVSTVVNKFYKGDLVHEKSKNTTPITLVRGGTVNTGYKYAGEMKTAILNFADALKYGGLVEDGIKTQEENICRCSNLYKVLEQEECQKNYYIPNRDFECAHFQSGIYTDRVIYSEGITVFKDDTTYASIEPRTLDVITCPAPRAIFDNQFEAISLYVRRLTQVVLSAVENGAECVVLGAWGCGAFNQVPESVAIAFGIVLKLYGGYFKKIVFAIKPTPHWGDDDLTDTFYRCLSDIYYEGMVRIDE